MSEHEKGEIVEKMASLPPDKQLIVEGFIMGLADAAKRYQADEQERQKDEPGDK